MTLYICGNSHTRALKAGLSLVQAEQDADMDMVVFPLGPSSHEQNPFSEIDSGRVVLKDNRYRKKLKQFFGFTNFSPDHQWGICMGNQYARLYGHETWHEFCPAWMGEAGKAPVSEALFERMVAEDQAHCRAFFDQLLETGVRFFFIEAPFPLMTHPAIAEVGIDPKVVKAVDAKARSVTAHWLGARGVPIVSTPPETADDNGFLLTSFAKGGNDPYHGNQFYGRLMMERILEHSKQPAPQPSA